MNISINLREDKELRKEIKDLVKGQVVNIAREIFVEEFSKALSKKLENVSITSNQAIDILKQRSLNKGSDSFFSNVFNQATDKLSHDRIDNIFEERLQALLSEMDMNNLSVEIDRKIAHALSLTSTNLHVPPGPY